MNKIEKKSATHTLVAVAATVLGVVLVGYFARFAMEKVIIPGGFDASAGFPAAAALSFVAGDILVTFGLYRAFLGRGIENWGFYAAMLALLGFFGFMIHLASAASNVIVANLDTDGLFLPFTILSSSARAFVFAGLVLVAGAVLPGVAAWKFAKQSIDAAKRALIKENA